jgi:hypothetical protein
MLKNMLYRYIQIINHLDKNNQNNTIFLSYFWVDITDYQILDSKMNANT